MQNAFNSGRNSRRSGGVSNVSVPHSLPARFGEQEHLEQQLNPGMAADWPWGAAGTLWGHFGDTLGTPRGPTGHSPSAASDFQKKSGSEKF